MEHYLEIIRNVLTVLGATAIFWGPLLARYWPSGARTAMRILAKIDSVIIKEIEDAIARKAVPGITLKSYILKLGADRKWGLDSTQVDAIVAMVKPLAKKCGWTVT